jgi:hypothetical protein
MEAQLDLLRISYKPDGRVKPVAKPAKHLVLTIFESITNPHSMVPTRTVPCEILLVDDWIWSRPRYARSRDSRPQARDNRAKNAVRDNGVVGHNRSLSKAVL